MSETLASADPEVLRSLPNAAKLAGLGKNALYEPVRRGELKTIQLTGGGDHKVKLRWVNEWAEQQARGGRRLSQRGSFVRDADGSTYQHSTEPRAESWARSMLNAHPTARIRIEPAGIACESPSLSSAVVCRVFVDGNSTQAIFCAAPAGESELTFECLAPLADIELVQEQIAALADEPKASAGQ